jgi:hypothetical protein
MLADSGKAKQLSRQITASNARFAIPVASIGFHCPENYGVNGFEILTRPIKVPVGFDYTTVFDNSVQGRYFVGIQSSGQTQNTQPAGFTPGIEVMRTLQRRTDRSLFRSIVEHKNYTSPLWSVSL